MSGPRTHWDRRWVCITCPWSTESVFYDYCKKCGGDLRRRSCLYEWQAHRVQWWRPSTWKGGRWVYTGTFK